MSGLVDHPRIVGARVAGHAQLRDVLTSHVEADLERQPSSEAATLGYEWESTFEFGYDLESLTLFIEGSYKLVVQEASKHSGHASDDHEVVTNLASVNFVLASIYSLRTPDDGSEPFDDEEFQAFAESTAQFAMYPFARELVRDLTSRLSLPPLTLPMLKIDLPAPVKRNIP